LKKDYIEDLKDELEESPLLRSEMYQILRKYEELYDDYMDDGMAPSEVEKKLGTPSEIVSDIMSSRKKVTQWLNPVVYFTFLLSAIIYLMIGYFTGLWHPTWLVFLLSPIVYFYKRN